MRRLACLTGIIVTLAGGVVLAQSEPGYDRVTGRAFASRSEVIAVHGMAATSQPLVTQIALDILKAGGNSTLVTILSVILLKDRCALTLRKK